MSYNKETTCVLPWINIDRNIDIITSVDSPAAPCCLYEPKKPTADYMEMWRSEELKQVRQQMRNGSKPSQCNKCWKEEAIGKKSMRMAVNDRLPEFVELIKLDEVDAPRQARLMVGDACNLACRMCLPAFSFNVRKIWDSLALGKNKYHRVKFDQQLYDIILRHSKELAYVDVIGGEPFFNKQFEKFIDVMIEKGDASHITLFITSNGTMYKPDLVEKLRQFKKVVLSISLDGINEVHEYIRPTTSFKQVADNMSKFRKYFDVLVASTISVLNICRLHELDQWCEDNKFHMIQKQLIYEPNELHPKQLPESMHHLVHEGYKTFLAEPKTTSCLDFISRLDENWKTDIKLAMPEWKDASDKMENKFKLYKGIKNYLDKVDSKVSLYSNIREYVQSI